MTPIEITGDSLHATLDPHRGAGISALYLLTSNGSIPLMPDVGDPTYDRDSASFLMVPYSNRIENGRFTFLKKEYQLDNVEQQAIHGDVRRRPWNTEESSTDRVVFGFESRRYRHLNWPWPFTARAEHRIRDHTFNSTLTLCNRSSESMPAGLGWHPFFNRHLRPGEEEVRLCFKTPFVYPDANDNRIPSGPPRATNRHTCQQRGQPVRWQRRREWRQGLAAR